MIFEGCLHGQQHPLSHGSLLERGQDVQQKMRRATPFLADTL